MSWKRLTRFGQQQACQQPLRASLTARVTRCGRICISQRKINLSKAFADQVLGLREVDDQVWLVNFMEYDLGLFGQNEDQVEPGPIPSPRRKC
jgi:hypothetical protein